MQAKFSAEALIADSIKASGFSDFGDFEFREVLQELLSSLESEANLNAVGFAVQSQRIADILANRLVLQEYTKRFPEILDEKIVEPLIILGLPRTGTTLLHRSIAADPRIMAPLWYEVRFPAPPFSWDFRSPDPRIAPAVAEMDAMLAASPELSAIHPMDALGPDEEIMLLEQSFYSYMPDSQAHVPGYEKYLEGVSHESGYRYLKILLQFLQWQKKRSGQAGTRWALKTPHHIHFIDLVFKVFPDAKVVQSHRDPLQTIPSLASMIAAVWNIYSDHADPKVAAATWARKFEHGIRKTMAYRDALGGALDQARFLDLWFEDTVAEPLQAIEKIYDFLGMELTEQAEKEMLAWQAFNRRELRPPHAYTLEQFGFSESALKLQFKEYRERYILSRTTTRITA